MAANVEEFKISGLEDYLNIVREPAIAAKNWKQLNKPERYTMLGLHESRDDMFPEDGVWNKGVNEAYLLLQEWDMADQRLWIVNQQKFDDVIEAVVRRAAANIGQSAYIRVPSKSKMKKDKNCVLHHQANHVVNLHVLGWSMDSVPALSTRYLDRGVEMCQHIMARHHQIHAGSEMGDRTWDNIIYNPLPEIWVVNLAPFLQHDASARVLLNAVMGSPVVQQMRRVYDCIKVKEIGFIVLDSKSAGHLDEETTRTHTNRITIPCMSVCLSWTQ